MGGRSPFCMVVVCLFRCSAVLLRRNVVVDEVAE